MAAFALSIPGQISIPKSKSCIKSRPATNVANTTTRFVYNNEQEARTRAL
jgi:hypothetical protein